MHIYANKKAIRKVSIYNEFVLWSAMPPVERVRLGIENQDQFASYYEVETSTLSRWKHRAGYQLQIREILDMWARGRTPDVVQGIYRAAIKGNSMSQLLWLQYIEGYNPKSKKVAEQSLFTANDIRSLVNMLPEAEKTKHLGYLRQLLNDINDYKAEEQDNDSIWTDKPLLNLPEYADREEQHVEEKVEKSVIKKKESAPLHLTGSVVRCSHWFDNYTNTVAGEPYPF